MHGYSYCNTLPFMTSWYEGGGGTVGLAAGGGATCAVGWGEGRGLLSL